MLFPKYIKKGDTIGVTATSAGIVDEFKVKRFHNGKRKLEEAGYKVVFTPNVFTADKRGCSSTGKERGDQFNALIKDDSVSAIYTAAGGDYLMEMLEHVDFEAIKKNPKWVQGYSDSTTLLYPITTLTCVATAYGSNFSDFGMEPWHTSVSRGFDILKGKEKVQTSFEYYENDFHNLETGLEGYFPDEKVCWLNGRNEDRIQIQGRLLGGCLDVISFLVGTRYDGTASLLINTRMMGLFGIWRASTWKMWLLLQIFGE